MPLVRPPVTMAPAFTTDAAGTSTSCVPTLCQWVPAFAPAPALNYPSPGFGLVTPEVTTDSPQSMTQAGSRPGLSGIQRTSF